MSLVHDMIHEGDTESLIHRCLKVGNMTPHGHKKTNPAQCSTKTGSFFCLTLCGMNRARNWKGPEVKGLWFTRYADDYVIAAGSEVSCANGNGLVLKKIRV